MSYPKMLYKGEAVYSDSAQIRDDLASRKIHTHIVANEDQEKEKRGEGWVDLVALLKRPTLKLSKSDHAA